MGHTLSNRSCQNIQDTKHKNICGLPSHLSGHKNSSRTEWGYMNRDRAKRYNKVILMLGTSSAAWGGIATVIDIYRKGGLFERHPIVHLVTHCTGSASTKLLLYLKALFRFVNMVVRKKVSLVHIHVAAGVSFWRKSSFLVLGILFRVPTILHVHTGHFPEFYESKCNSFAKAFVRWILSNADCVIVVSTVLKEWVLEISPQRNVKTIFNPMVVTSQTQFRTRSPNKILFLGKLGTGKGTYDLLQAMWHLAQCYPDLKLLLGGDGEVTQSRNMAKSLGIERSVEFLGWVDSGTRTRLLAEATIFVLPSYAEGLPMSILEAMAAGLVVVATTVGGIPEAITDGVEGYLVAPGDIDSLARAIGHLLSNVEEREHMGMAGRTKAENIFESSLTIPLIEAIYSIYTADPIEN